MPFQFPTSFKTSLKRQSLFAPGTFRQNSLYRVRGLKLQLIHHKMMAVAEATLRTRLGRLNVAFQYMYRDASNYKQHGEAVFANRTCLPLIEIDERIRACLNDGKYFIAQQICIEERFFDTLHDDDHPWHEYERAEATTLAAFDPDNWTQRQHRRDISEFLSDLEKASRTGWDEMRVRVDVAQLLERQKAELRQNQGS